MMSLVRKTVLIIDDDDTVCKVLSLTLKRGGMTVLMTTKPREGLEIVRSQPLDSVISDVRMPEMSGLDLLQTLRAEGIPIPFVIISSHSSRDILLSSLRMGAFDLINKPMQASVITRVMEEAIRVGQRQSQIARLQPPGAEMSALDQAISWILANMSPLFSLAADQFDQQTLAVLSETDAKQRVLAAAALAMQKSRSVMDDLRNFQDRTWNLGVLIRLFNGRRASFEALGDRTSSARLATLEGCFAWLRVRPEDLSADLAILLALIGEHLTKTFKDMRGATSAPDIAELEQQIASLETRLQKTYQRAAS
jgi:FixJ family two-component response regulator